MSGSDQFTTNCHWAKSVSCWFCTFKVLSYPEVSLCPFSAASPAVVSKTEMNVVVRNPEIVFVADLTRADAPALVMTTQCELVIKSDAEGSHMAAVIKDLKVHIFIVVFQLHLS